MNAGTARYAVIGMPVTHSLSPVMQQAAFDASGIDARYEAIEAGKDNAAAVFARLRGDRYAGWNVTTPLKEAAVALVDRLTESAAAARAVNAVRAAPDGSLIGHNTDGAGFVRAASEVWSWDPRGASILILGTGPAARAIALALREHGAGRLTCWSRDARRAASIAPPPNATPELVVSALPADATVAAHILELCSDAAMVFDVNYAAARSPVAGVRATRTSNGLPLLLHQGALSFEWWTNQEAPLAIMRAALHADSM